MHLHEFEVRANHDLILVKLDGQARLAFAVVFWSAIMNVSHDHEKRFTTFFAFLQAFMADIGTHPLGGLKHIFLRNTLSKLLYLFQ